MASLIRFILSNVPLFALILAIFLSISRGKKVTPFVERFIRYLLLLPIGIAGLWAFLFHAFFPEIAAASIGWEPSPFQFEVAVANLGMGIAGGVGFFKRNFNFSLAIAIMAACFLWGAAFGHIREIFAAHDWSSNNTGPILWTDILIPACLIGSLLVWKKKKAK